eukprot:3433881-Prymnesium_polylepis.1
MTIRRGSARRPPRRAGARPGTAAVDRLRRVTKVGGFVTLTAAVGRRLVQAMLRLIRSLCCPTSTRRALPLPADVGTTPK